MWPARGGSKRWLRPVSSGLSRSSSLVRSGKTRWLMMTLCSKLSDSYTSFRWVIYEHRARSRARGRCHLRIGLLNLWRILSGSAAGGNIPLGSEWPSPPITCFHAWIELRHWLRFRPFFNCVVLPWWLGSIRSNSEAIVWYNTWIRREVWGLLVGTGGGGGRRGRRCLVFICETKAMEDY